MRRGHFNNMIFCVSQTCHTKEGEQSMDNVHMLEENITNYAYWGQLVLDLLRPSVVVYILRSAIASYYNLVRNALI